ncbi:DNA-binding GntR family transcriptional regulator [Mycetocola sp. BIGb0189]|uniref:GntR family transcriptional regulator n=1 Tax=Mycetocola sp. BIGb0189 TaxID=2940604 RepID=UPI002169E28F|nr:GntR family transcriptional regulator [Mycetocola sp. BIGb0189]MCS4275668.1 DNA-binding GntR family transcriptional regulator [Mycetocola sp. BIGb0189]
MDRSTRHGIRQYGAHAQQLLGESVFERLLADIMSGRFTPHERLRVDEIARELAVSRTPVREAITRLAWTGFVDVARNSHTQITNWNTGDMCDRLRVSGELTLLALEDERLELRSLRLAHMTPADLATGCDTRSYLGLIEDIVHAPWSRSVNRILDELHRSLRLYLCSPLLQQHGISLSVNAAMRATSLTSLTHSLRDEDRGGAVRHLSDYLDALVPLFEPR